MKNILLLEFLPKKIRNISIFAISLVFIAGGAVNNGFSKFIFAIPFLVLFFIKLKDVGKNSKIILVLLLAIVCVPLGWNKSRNTILYPYLNTEVVFSPGWGYVKFSDSDHYSLIPPEDIKFYRTIDRTESHFYSKSLTMIDRSTKMRMVEMDVSCPDFETQLSPIFIDLEGNKYLIFSQELIKGIKDGTINGDEIEGVNNFQSNWTEFLGDLMYWPISPLIIFNSLSVY